MLPGVPKECEPMMKERVMPILSALSDGVIHSRTLKIFGKGESEVEALLHDQMCGMTNPTLAPYAKSGEVELRITAKAPTIAEAETMLDPVEAELREILGDVIYGVDVGSLEEQVVKLLREQGKTLGTAESCTGGWIAKRITDIPGASQVFRGGIVSYTNEVKRDLLQVPQQMLDTWGAVSPQVAEAMAEGAQRVLGCDLAVSVTGLAGSETDEFGHTGGTVFLALSDGTHTWVKETHRGVDRNRVRLVSGHTALDMVRRYLTGLPV
jgi:nicotinamide-nucleotide amidase